MFDEISSTIARCGFPFHRAHIEITESVLIEDQELALDSIRQFKSAGFGIALDDFGTGFSSLTRLDALPSTS
ncbi:EAL domain-containing protein [Rhizobium sp. L51/94]|nr:EAL domain-containing protein [Rhizobium sp. L51/94]